MTKNKIYIVGLFLSFQSYAAIQKKSVNQVAPQLYAVNMQDGGLILKENAFTMGAVDEGATSSQNKVSDSAVVGRTYRSRSLYRGHFGMGWCTDFESELIFQAKGQLRLQDCQVSKPILFQLNQTASGYINSKDPQDVIVIKLGFYERRIHGEWLAHYDYKGRLTAVKHGDHEVKILFNSRGLPDRLLEGSSVIQFKWHPILDLVEKIKTPSTTWNLKYNGFDLVEASHDGVKVEYQYDDLDNLILRQQGLQSLKVAYDREKDQVLEVLADSCREIYTYKPRVKGRSISSVAAACGDADPVKRNFTFEYSSKAVSPHKITVLETNLSRLERLSFNQTAEGAQ
jgi:hypothetical protein